MQGKRQALTTRFLVDGLWSMVAKELTNQEVRNNHPYIPIHTCTPWQYGNFGFPTGCSMEIRFSYYSARFRTIRTGRGFFLKSRPAPPPVAPGEGVSGSRGPRFRTGFVLVSYYPYWPRGFVPWSLMNYPCRSRRLIGHTANS